MFQVAINVIRREEFNISESVRDVGNFKLSMEYTMLKGFQVNGETEFVEEGSISLERRSICSGLGPRWSDTIKGDG